MEKVLNFMKENKKKLFIGLGAIVLIAVLVILAITFIFNDAKEEVGGLNVTYVDGETIKIENISDGYSTIKKFTIENTNDENVTYSLEWLNVSNTFKTQSNLLYEVNPTSGTQAKLGTSQVPVADSNIFSSVVIKPGETHTYEVKVWYKDKTTGEKDSKFTGTLKVDSSGVVDKEKQEKEMKTKLEEERAKQEKELEKEKKEKKDNEL
jgi:hypothetical protein